MTDAEALESVQQFLNSGSVSFTQMEALARVVTLATASIANAKKYQECREAIYNAYFTGIWTAEGVDEARQAAVWQQLRDAAGIPEGSATAQGLGA